MHKLICAAAPVFTGAFFIYSIRYIVINCSHWQAKHLYNGIQTRCLITSNRLSITIENKKTDCSYLRGMQIMKWLSIASILVLVIACFFPWISIESKNITVTGFNAEAVNLGKPGLIHVFLSFIFLVFLLLNKTWSIRAAFFISAFNIAWGIRNFFELATCIAGICPVKHTALYIVLIVPLLATIFLLLMTGKRAV